LEAKNLNNCDKGFANLPILIRKAQLSEEGEVFAPLRTGTRSRVGIGARIGGDGEVVAYFEVLLTPEGREVDLSVMERKLAVLRALKEMGFTLNGEEDGSISCERVVTAISLPKIYDIVMEALTKERLEEGDEK
jgi:hypothetical protein